MPDKASIIDAFFTYAQREQQREAEALIKEENLNEEAGKALYPYITQTGICYRKWNGVK
nr:hypothetical protein [Klebsiella pneumoniae]